MGKIYLGTQGGVPFVYEKIEHIGVPRILDNGVMRIGLSTDSYTVSLPSSVTELGYHAMYYGFYQDKGVTSADLSNITTISGEYAMGYAFSECSNLVSVDLSSLAIVNSNYALRQAFRRCTSLTTLSFPALTTSSFGYYTTQFNDMISGCSGVTVHFPSAIQSTIGSWTSVRNGFGGTNTTVLFDL